jgi:hypothetical protein
MVMLTESIGFFEYQHTVRYAAKAQKLGELTRSQYREAVI